MMSPFESSSPLTAMLCARAVPRTSRFCLCATAKERIVSG
jgi:hypothetical protein